MQVITKTKSKYLKDPRERTLFHRFAIAYIFALYIMPQYFGIPNPVFDLTAVRVMIIALLGFIICDYNRYLSFTNLISTEKIGKYLIPYIFVLLYTMVLRADLNAFLNPFIEILELFLMVYVIRDSIGVDKMVSLVMGFIYFLVIMGIIESFLQFSPFSLLVNLQGVYAGTFVRGGHYRVMSNCAHSLGYGLLLMTALPFEGYDMETGKYDILRRPVLLVGIIVNVFMTGSRSTLGILFWELLLMLVLTEKNVLKKDIFFIGVSFVIFVVVIICLQKTSFGNYVLLQLTSVIDALLGTEYSVAYGADLMALTGSTAYRDQLKSIFSVSWLNPLVGIGRKRNFQAEINGTVIISVDNFYIAEYIRYGYPGMITYIIFLLYMVINMVRDMYRTKSALIKTIFIGSFCYLLHLYIADSLQTLKYLYVLFAIYLCCDRKEQVFENKSRYIKKRVLFKSFRRSDLAYRNKLKKESKYAKK